MVGWKDGCEEKTTTHFTTLAFPSAFCRDFCSSLVTLLSRRWGCWCGWRGTGWECVSDDKSILSRCCITASRSLWYIFLFAAALAAGWIEVGMAYIVLWLCLLLLCCYVCICCVSTDVGASYYWPSLSSLLSPLSVFGIDSVNDHFVIV